jgi:predicted Rossmann fold nucleotide-binding protein DprA/Smf involved in DNA uptake
MTSVATHDSQAIALLCAPVAVGDAKPLTPSEWAKLATAIVASELEGPGALVGLDAARVGEMLGTERDVADRVAALLDRGGTLAFELERLAGRGIWIVTRADDDYPARLRRLGLRAPAVLFGAGRRNVVPGRAVAVVGSRDASTEALEFAEELGRSVAGEDGTVVSGAARGVDRVAMNGALDAGGKAVGVVAEALVRLTQQPDVREALVDERLTLLTPYAPEARFTVGNAMGRNKLIYCLSDAAVVVATSAGSGGTWAGAIENLKGGWAPLWVWDGPVAPDGNRELLVHGGMPLPSPSPSLVLDRDPAPESVVAMQQPADGIEELERLLVTPMSETEVRQALGLGQGRARALLKQGVDSGVLLRQGKPFRYVLADASDQPTLFDAA